MRQVERASMLMMIDEETLFNAASLFYSFHILVFMPQNMQILKEVDGHVKKGKKKRKKKLT